MFGIVLYLLSTVCNNATEKKAWSFVSDDSHRYTTIEATRLVRIVGRIPRRIVCYCVDFS